MRILITARLPEQLLEPICRLHSITVSSDDRPFERERLLREIREQDGLLCSITDRIDREIFERAPRLKMIANYGVGFDHIDLAEATRRRIPVSNTPGVLTDATADLAFALILAVGRRLVEGDRLTRAGDFQFWAPFHFLGREVSGKTLGIIGLGRIGQAVARRAAGFNMRILYHNRKRLLEAEELQLGAKYCTQEELLSQADFISLHVPLTPDTHHLIGTGQLRSMKPDAILINTSRGPVVDERALVAALEQGEIGGAGLDVYENEPELVPGLEQLSNVVLVPHIGSATVETRTRMGTMAVANLLAGLAGRLPDNCLNREIFG